jgi:hypothetical protein
MSTEKAEPMSPVLDQVEKIRKKKEIVARGVFLTNGQVAWEIETGRLANRYLHLFYFPPIGWRVIRNLESIWLPGRHGEYRLIEESENGCAGLPGSGPNS